MPQPDWILIVDDEENVRVLVGRIVAGEGYPYDAASSVDQALAMLRQEPPCRWPRPSPS